MAAPHGSHSAVDVDMCHFVRKGHCVGLARLLELSMRLGIRAVGDKNHSFVGM